MLETAIPPSAALKAELLFEGIRYTEALGRAAEHAYPNYSPYRFAADETDPTGRGFAPIPYLLVTEDGTTLRIKGSGRSPWSVSGDAASGYQLVRDGQPPIPVSFEPLPQWLTATTRDGRPMAQVGLNQHSDMMVVNVAPGCEYFTVAKQDGQSMRCTFCAYGAPDARSRMLGQVMDQPAIPADTLARMQEALSMAIDEGVVGTIYLVGGSMTDWRQEGERYLMLAEKVAEVNRGRVPVSCGSGALPDDILDDMRGRRTIDNVCFNLEVWSNALFAKVCPGKNRFVGYERWLAALEHAVSRWGRGHVYSAMVAGIELEPEYGLTWEQASDLAAAGAEDLCRRGVLPIYSLYWPLGGRDRANYSSDLKGYFMRLNMAYRETRRHHDLHIWDGFLTHRSAYMQLECDMDRGMAAA